MSATGIITDIILEENSKNIRVILVQYDNCNDGEEAKINSTYKHVNEDSVPTSKVQASATINGCKSCQGSRTQFPPCASLGNNNSQMSGINIGRNSGRYDIFKRTVCSRTGICCF